MSKHLTTLKAFFKKKKNVQTDNVLNLKLMNGKHVKITSCEKLVPITIGEKKQKEITKRRLTWTRDVWRNEDVLRN